MLCTHVSTFNCIWAPHWHFDLVWCKGIAMGGPGWACAHPPVNRTRTECTLFRIFVNKVITKNLTLEDRDRKRLNDKGRSVWPLKIEKISCPPPPRPSQVFPPHLIWKKKSRAFFKPQSVPDHRRIKGQSYLKFLKCSVLARNYSKFMREVGKQ